ncbi:hypothetical protein BGZ72_009132, partial [Mortierella alpina]
MTGATQHSFKGQAPGSGSPRNSLLTVGVSKYSRSQVFAKRALYKRKPAGSVAAAPAAANKTVEVKGAKNGGSR